MTPFIDLAARHACQRDEHVFDIGAGDGVVLPGHTVVASGWR